MDGLAERPFSSDAFVLKVDDSRNLKSAYGTSTTTRVCTSRIGGQSVGWLFRQDDLVDAQEFLGGSRVVRVDEIEIVLSQEDRSRFRSVTELVQDVRLHGYYGGVRLVKATIKKFVEFCEQQRWALHDRKFSVRYESNIPRQVGLAGSSAIIVATLRALMDFY